MGNKGNRNSNFELLRVLAILMIISLHCFRHSADGRVFASHLTFNKFVFILIGSWGLVGVDIFIFISSWFLLDDNGKTNRVNLAKVIQIIIMVGMYNLLTYMINHFVTGNQVAVNDVIKSMLSALIGQYWFVIAYLLLYIIHPVLNSVINSLCEKTLYHVSFSLFILVFVYKYIYGSAPIGTLSIFISIYFISALIKRNFLSKKIMRVVYGAGIFSFAFIIIIQVLYSIIGEDHGLISIIINRITISSISKYSPFMLLIAVSLFLYCSQRKDFCNLKVNKLASTTLAVYVLHESDYINTIIWDKCFHISSIFTRIEFPVLLIVIVISVFFVCAIIDLIVQPVYAVISKCFGKSWEKILRTYNGLIN